MRLDKQFKKWVLLMIIVSLGFPLVSFVRIHPKTDSVHLFKIERSVDRNFISYDVNVISNKLDAKSPLRIYWVNPTENGMEKPLTWIQKKFSYGVAYLDIDENRAEFQFVSYTKRQFQIERDSNGRFQVFTKSGNRKVKVNKIFIQIDGGTFWFPKISRVEIHCQNLITQEPMVEIIHP